MLEAEVPGTKGTGSRVSQQGEQSDEAEQQPAIDPGLHDFTCVRAD